MRVSIKTLYCGLLALTWCMTPALQADESGPPETEESRATASLGFFDNEDGRFDTSDYLAEAPLGFLPVPVVITDPATGNGLAIGAVFFHETDEQRKQRIGGGALLPENITVIGGGGTENGTRGAGAAQFGFWREDTLRYKGYAFYPDLYLDFYSLPGFDLPRPIELNMKGPFVEQSLSVRIADSDWFVGARQVLRHVETELGSLPSVLPPDWQDFLNQQIDSSITTSGAGVVVEYDSTNNPLNPVTGYNVSASSLLFRGAIGSDVDYESYQLTALSFWQFQRRFDVGLRLDYQAVQIDSPRDLPPYAVPGVSLRGVPSARYQGFSVATAEVQLGYHLDQRWKLHVFSGLARAADDFSALENADNVDTLGTGFRYLIARRYGFSMGLDVARGPEETAWYIQAGSDW